MIYIYIYIYIYTRVNIYINIYTYIYICIYIYVYVYKYIHICVSYDIHHTTYIYIKSYVNAYHATVHKHEYIYMNLWVLCVLATGHVWKNWKIPHKKRSWHMWCILPSCTSFGGTWLWRAPGAFMCEFLCIY